MSLAIKQPNKTPNRYPVATGFLIKGVLIPTEGKTHTCTCFAPK